MNYLSSFLSLWIANLGVVPLFLFSAFLCVPWLFFLFLRMIRVFFVKEPIKFSSGCCYKIIRTSFLILCVLFVKDYSYGNDASSNGVYLLARGQQKELILDSPLKRFSVGNKESLKVKVLGSKKLLIKGQKLGFSDIKIWTKKSKSLYSFYILSKFEHLKKHQFIEILDHYGLEIKPLGQKIIVSGAINDLDSYLKILKITQESPNSFILNLTLSEQIQTNLKALVYQELFTMGSFEHKCSFQNNILWCRYPEESINSKTQEYLKKKYFIHFHSLGKKVRNKNYSAILIILSHQKTKSSNFDLGLTPLTAPSLDIWENKNYKHLIENNIVNANVDHDENEVLVKHEFTFSPGKKVFYELGAEIPFAQSNGLNTTLQWKFAGLKLSLLLDWENNNPIIHYDFALTQPQKESISGSKEQGQLYISYDRSIKLFNLSYLNQGQNQSSLPVIQNIPILKELFGGNSKRDILTQLSAIIVIKENTDGNP